MRVYVCVSVCVSAWVSKCLGLCVSVRVYGCVSVCDGFCLFVCSMSAVVVDDSVDNDIQICPPFHNETVSC